MKTKLSILILLSLVCMTSYIYFQQDARRDKHSAILTKELFEIHSGLNTETKQPVSQHSRPSIEKSNNDETQEATYTNNLASGACEYLSEVKPIYSQDTDLYDFSQERLSCVDALLNKLLSVQPFSVSERVILDIHMADIAKKLLANPSQLALIKALLFEPSNSDHQSILTKLIAFLPNEIQEVWASELLNSSALETRLAGISLLENIMSNGSDSAVKLFQNSLENASTPTEKNQLLKSTTLLDPTSIDEQLEDTLYEVLDSNITSEAATYAYESLLQTALFKTERALQDSDQTAISLSDELETLLEKGLASGVELHSRLALEMLNAVYVETISLSSLNQQYIEQIAVNESFSIEVRERASATLQQYSRALY
jgi:hypothetical protein